MAPGAKRKRGESSYGNDNDGSTRPSPHRPGNLSMAQRTQDYSQQNRSNYYGYRGGRRGGRGGGRGGSNATSPIESSGSFATRDNAQRPSDTGPQASQPAKAGPGSTTAKSPPPSQLTNPPPTQSKSTPVAESPAPAEVPPAEPPEPPAPFAYDYLTDERLSDWTSSGKEEVVQSASKSLQSNDFLSLSLIYQELIRAGLDNKLDPVEAGGVVQEILQNLPADCEIDGSSAFLDTLSILTDVDTTNPRLRPLVQATGIPLESMREQLEEPLLQSLGLIRSTFAKVFIRKQTNILYRQSNYNLLREESEGYSKLLTELFTRSSSAPTAETVEDVYENTKALIGSFDLDAGRVLDVTLDVFASVLVKFPKFFAKFLRTSSFWPHQQNFGVTRIDSQGFSGLPWWAEPGHSHWDLSPEEALSFSKVREDRDRQFWQRVREVGMDAYFELGSRQILRDEELPPLLNEGQSDDVRSVETRKWISTTRTLPPPGNDVAAQLLGFKLRFYASQARDLNDVLPVNLIYLAALLIKIGFISLRDLYTHLYPEDDSMDSVRDKQMKLKEEREKAKRPGGNAPNALEKAGALADDTLPAIPAQPTISRLRDGETRSGTPSRFDPPSSKAGTPAARVEEEEDKDGEKEQLPEPADQKVQLLRSLLCIGALPEALYMLGRFPWLSDAFPDLPDHIHRILHHSLSKVYDSLRPLKDRDSCKEASQWPDKDQTGLAKGEIRHVEPEKIKSLRWALLPKRDVNDGNDYRFYWDDWADNIPICQNIEDVFTLCSTFLNLSGVKIGQDPSLLLKIVRIGKYSLEEDTSEANTNRWYDLCKRLLCPALSMTKSNPGTVNEVWDILKLFSTKQRFAVYAEWFGGQISRLQDMQDCFNLVKFETRAVMKRMSTENTKLMARQLAKVACASPGIVFEVVLNQIQSYPNLTDTVVECGRYFTYMGYDVLTWSIMRALGNPNRERLTDTGFEASAWLQHLAEFCGKIFKRYSMMSPLPVLQYVLDQLRKDNFVDLRIFKDLLWYMAGIVAGVDFNDAQVEAMGGGQTLVSVTLKKVLDNRHISKGSSKRLLKILADHQLLGPYLVAIAQQRQMSIFKAEHNSLKIVSENFDSLTNIFGQYLDFIITNLSVKDSNVLIPSITELMAEYGVPVELAFSVHRRSLAKAIVDYDAEHGVQKAPPKSSTDEKPKINGDVEMADAASPEDSTDVSVPDGADNAGEEAKDNVEGVKTVEDDFKEKSATTEKTIPVAAATAVESPINPVLYELMDQIPAALPSDFSTYLSFSFYVRFWQLSLYDLTAPTKSYSDETAIQESRKRAVANDRADISASGMKRKEAEKKSIDEFITRLHEEVKNQVRDFQQTQRRLKEENKLWFEGFSGKWNTLNAALLQYCFIPRMLLSSQDSYFTFRMIFQMHSTATPEFRTMHVIDKLLSENTLTNIIFSCSSREADNLGRFLYELLKRLSGWHTDKATYEKEAYGMKKNLPGFAQNISSGKPDRFLEYEDFRRLLYKWHRRLFDSLKVCLSNTEYMHINNGINVLRRVSRVFPVVNWMGNHLSTQINEIITREKPEKDRPNKIVRADLWVSANSVIAGLKQREKAWVMPQAFMLNDATGKNQRSGARSASAAPKSPQPERSTPKPLNATAAEFAPKLQSQINGDSKTSGNVKVGEVEDGEVEDGETSSSQAREAVNQKSNNAVKDNGPAQQTAEPDAKAAESSTASETTHTAAKAPETKLQSASEALKAEDRETAAVRPSPGPSETTLKGESGRLTSAPSTPSRTPHTLPSRPEGPPPHRNRNEQTQQPSRTESRTRQGQDQGRLDRTQDLTRGPSTERPSSTHPRPESNAPSDRPGQYPDKPRDDLRYHDRNNRSAHDERALRGSTRDNRQDPQDRYGRPDYSDSPSSRPGSRGPLDPSRPSYPAPSGVPPQERSDGYSQPASYGSRPSMYDRTNSNHGPDTRRDRARPQSPSRSDSRHSNNASQMLDERSYPPSSRPQSYDSRHAGTDYAPSGPRGSHRSSEAMQPPPSRGPGSDRLPGRMNQDSSRPPPRHQDINYGRLNADPSPSPGAQTRRSREDNSAQNGDQPRDSSSEQNQPLAPEPSQRSEVPAGRRARASAAVENTSTAEVSQPAADTGSIHPSRLALLGQGGGPPPLQTDVGTTQGPSSASATSPSFSNVPSGPRSAQARGPDAATNLPSPTSRNPPTGPANTPDRRRDQRRMANIQETLNHNTPTTTTGGNDRNGDRGTSIRGRANASRQGRPPTGPPDGADDLERRDSRSQVSMQTSQPPSQYAPPEDVRPDQRERRDFRPNREDPNREYERDSGKSSYRSSREHSRERDPGRELEHPTRRGPPRGAASQEDPTGRTSRNLDRRGGRAHEGDLMQDNGGPSSGYAPPRNDRDMHSQHHRYDGERDNNRGGHHGSSHGHSHGHSHSGYGQDDGYNRPRGAREERSDDYNRRTGPPFPPTSRGERELMPPASQGPMPPAPLGPGGHQDWNGEGGPSGRGGSMRGPGRKRDWPGDGDQGYGGRLGDGKRPRRSGP